MLFTLITQHDSLKAAAIAALGAGVVIALPALIAGRPKVLELGAVLAFAGFTVVAFSADPATSAWLARYARAIAAGVLAADLGRFAATHTVHRAVRAGVGAAAVLVVSPLQGDQPRLTLMWSWVFIAMIPSHLIAGAVNTHRANTISPGSCPSS